MLQLPGVSVPWKTVRPGGFGGHAQRVAAPFHLPFSPVSYRNIRNCAAFARFVGAAYLGGRLVLGSGRTWPHDFRFFAGFFSVAGVDAESTGVANRSPGVGGIDSGSTDTVVAGVERATSCFDSEGNEGGVITADGFVGAEEACAENKEGYISPGADKSDSAGDGSNLSPGEPCSSQVGIFSRVNGKTRECSDCS